MALVHVLAYTETLIYRNVRESSIANATIRAHGIFAMTVLFANVSVIFHSVDAALVDVDTLVVGKNRVTVRTLADVVTLTIQAGLTGTALVSVVGAFVDVDASASAYRIQNITAFTTLEHASLII